MKVKTLSQSQAVRFRRWVSICLVVGCGGMGLLASIPISRPLEGPHDFELQVVLGGDTNERSAVSYTLWRHKPTPILVTGDDGLIRLRLLKLGVPSSSIIHEAAARSTWQNALFSSPLLGERNVQRVVLITSWYHTARAYACFTKCAPGVKFGIKSDEVPVSFSWDRFEISLKERMKLLAYWYSYHLNPWG